MLIEPLSSEGFRGQATQGAMGSVGVWRTTNRDPVKFAEADDRARQAEDYVATPYGRFPAVGWSGKDWSL